MDKDTCYDCEHSSLCFLKFLFNDVIATGTGTLLNIDSDIRPGKFTDIYEAVAMACKKFERREES